MKTTPQCPLCDSCDWIEKSHTEDYSYKGHDFSLAHIQYSECARCSFELVLPSQRRANQTRLANERRRIDGLLTGGEIREIRTSLGLTQQEAASLLGGGQNAFSKYERGEVDQSVVMDRLLRYFDTVPHSFDQFLRVTEEWRVSEYTFLFHWESDLEPFIEKEIHFKDMRSTKRKLEYTHEDIIDDAA